MLNDKKIFFILAFFAMVCGGMYAQSLNPSNNGNTPYSRYGYGRLAETSMVRNRAMGGIGLGLRSNQQTNPANPASYTAIDSLTFLFDLAVNGQVVNYTEADETQKKWNGGLDYLVMQVPMGKYLSASFGLMPFSYVGYSYGAYDSLSVDNPSLEDAESLKYIQQYSGEGGLNKVYLGFGAQPFKWVSLGVNLGFIYGEISNNWAVSFPSNPIDATYSYRHMSAKAFDVEFGAQFMHTFAKKHEVVLGAVFAPEMNMKIHANHIMTTSQSDTIPSKATVGIPVRIGAGFTYIYDKKLTVGLDAKMERWSTVDALNDELVVEKNLFGDRKTLAVGAEYLPDLMSRNYLKRMRYRLGANFSDAYTVVQRSQNREYSVTAGLGLPLKNQKTMVNMAIEYVNVKPQNSAFLSESYIQLNVGLTFNEFWFFKNKLK